ncbi:MAG: nucleotidyltransferase family protein [Acidobacteriota bacterium]
MTTRPTPGDQQRIDGEADILALISADPWRLRVLKVAAREDLRDWWIVAGFVRSAVWDALHGYTEPTPLGDVDLVFFDPTRAAREDRSIEERLRRTAPDVPWEVYNQAHMHEYNHDTPYTDAVDSFSRWAETVSTVAVRMEADGSLRLAAPCGLDDLIGMVLRPNPHPDARRDIFEQRLRTKKWRELWPRAQVVRD